ncbi:putative mediator of RNA polymerase II transcription subunit 7 [Dioscorea cayenensis subsp. rotundata]|uniref:Mediator of RNA polymerase II transcription subunit 7 n=1 Tax=Dioscorea cayennensis subsp. rotundata TaxID=55577 RepID=A0AB40CYP3_DIOCR|nr:putative mediator of RNA polymerase II transcription subunit 7 [Dioscorea cayenensis subsp. rotundata]
MVSLQAAALNPGQVSMKKRKWQADREEEQEEHREPKRKDDIELNLETPLPLEWQRCLDIKSGEIHYYNTRTKMRTSKDPREISTEAVVSLDLELNLASHANDQHNNNNNNNNNMKKIKKKNSLDLSSNDEKENEMIAAVCMRCHMLVMMCKASPACPNCKFLHPPTDRSSPAFLKPALSLRLLCCKD